MENNRNESVSVGTTVVLAAPERGNANAYRKVIVLTNTSTGGQVISLAVDKEAVAGSGIVISPGGVFQDAQDGAYMPTQAYITAVSSAAGGTLAVYERVIS